MLKYFTLNPKKYLMPMETRRQLIKFVSVAIASFILGILISSKLQVEGDYQVYDLSMIPTNIRIDTVYLEQEDVVKIPENYLETVEFFESEDESSFYYKDLRRDYGRLIEDMSEEDLRYTMEYLGFRNLEGANKFYLRRIFLCYAYNDFFYEVHRRTEFPVSFIFSYFIMESTYKGVETDLWAIEGNPGGVKSKSGYYSTKYKTEEIYGGKRVTVTEAFSTTSSMEEAAKMWSETLNSDIYKECKSLYRDMYKMYVCVGEKYHTSKDYKKRYLIGKQYWDIVRDNFPK